MNRFLLSQVVKCVHPRRKLSAYPAVTPRYSAGIAITITIDLVRVSTAHNDVETLSICAFVAIAIFVTNVLACQVNVPSNSIL